MVLVCTDHNLTVLSSEAEISCWLSGLNWTLLTAPWWPLISWLSPFMSATHSLMVLSRLAEATK